MALGTSLYFLARKDVNFSRLEHTAALACWAATGKNDAASRMVKKGMVFNDYLNMAFSIAVLACAAQD